MQKRKRCLSHGACFNYLRNSLTTSVYEINMGKCLSKADPTNKEDVPKVCTPVSSLRAYEIIGSKELQLYRASLTCRSPGVGSSPNLTIVSRSSHPSYYRVKTSSNDQYSPFKGRHGHHSNISCQSCTYPDSGSKRININKERYDHKNH